MLCLNGKAMEINIGRVAMAGLLFWVMSIGTGCTTRIGDFSVASTGTPQYSKMLNAPVRQNQKGDDGRFWFLFIPFGSAPSLEDAVDDCLDEGGGDYIERVRLYSEWWTVLLFSGGKFEVVGDVGNTKAGNYGQATDGPTSGQAPSTNQPQTTIQGPTIIMSGSGPAPQVVQPNP